MGQRNIIVGLILGAFATGYGALALQLPERNIEGTPGPGFVPELIAVILLLLSIALVIQGLRILRAGNRVAAPGGPDRRAVTMLVAFAVYIGLLPLFGFLVASIPFVAVLIRAYGDRNRLLVPAVSIALPVFLFLLFREGFGVFLPAGTYGLFGG